MKKLALITGAAMLAGVGATNADELLTLTPAEMDGVTAGGVAKFDADIDVYKDVDIDIYKDIYKDVWVHQRVRLKGNYAEAEAVADAYGYNTFAETFTGAATDSYSSNAYSSSEAATDSYRHDW